MSKRCGDCHHEPSRRTAEYGAACQCRCHDVADAAPDLLAALRGLLDRIENPKHFGNRESLDKAKDTARAALAKAEGK